MPRGAYLPLSACANLEDLRMHHRLYSLKISTQCLGDNPSSWLAKCHRELTTNTIKLSMHLLKKRKNITAWCLAQSRIDALKKCHFLNADTWLFPAVAQSILIATVQPISALHASIFDNGVTLLNNSAFLSSFTASPAQLVYDQIKFANWSASSFLLQQGWHPLGREDLASIPPRSRSDPNPTHVLRVLYRSIGHVNTSEYSDIVSLTSEFTEIV